MNGQAELHVEAEGRDIALLAARSAGIWMGLALDDEAHAVLRRDGLDPAALRLSGHHPFEFTPAHGGGFKVVAHASDKEAAEALLDLFRIYFFRRLLA